MRTLTAKEVRNKLNGVNDTVLINTLGSESFQAKHLPGSINIPADKIEKVAPKVLADKTQEIIVYCASPDCSASPTAAEKLKELGYKNVFDFEAGLTGWLKEGFELIPADE